jgi:hypothetical protein
MHFGLLQRRSFSAVASCLLALCLVASDVPVGFPVQMEPMSLQAVVVDIAVVPSSKTVDLHDTFTLKIYVYANGQQVDAVDADLTFDPAYLEVQSITGSSSGLGIEMYSGFDNTNGTLTHSRVTFGPFPDSTFQLCSIKLKAKAPTGGTTLAFTDLTNAWFGGPSVLRNTTDGTIIITSPYPPGDLNQDCVVDVDDIMLVASRWRTSCANPNPDGDPNTPNYDPLYDLDEDCNMDIVDIMLVVIHWGKTC